MSTSVRPPVRDLDRAERWHTAGGNGMQVRFSRTLGKLFAVHRVAQRGADPVWEVWIGASTAGRFATLYLAKVDADLFERQMAELMARLTVADRAPAEQAQEAKR